MKDYFEIKDKRDLDFIGRNLLLQIVIIFLLFFLISGWVASAIFAFIFTFLTLLLIYAIIVLRNLKVIESEQYRKAYRWGAYGTLIVFSFFLIGMICVIAFS